MWMVVIFIVIKEGVIFHVFLYSIPYLKKKNQNKDWVT